MTEATLPLEERGLQRRYTQLSRFNLYLPPTGKFTLPGPETWKLQNPAEGMYLILLRIEATEDTNFGGGEVARSGGVAGFPMPVLRYYIGSGTGDISKVEDKTLTLLSPAQDATIQGNDALFKWREALQVAFYRLEIEDAQGALILSAILPRGVSSYRAPSFLKEKTEGVNLRWRVVAFDQAGNQIAQTPKRAFQLHH